MVDEESKGANSGDKPGGKFGLEIAGAQPQGAEAATEVGSGGFSDILARMEGAKNAGSEGASSRPSGFWSRFSIAGFIIMTAAAGACVMLYIFYMDAAARVERMDSAMAEFSRALSYEKQKNGRMDEALLRMELKRSMAALDKVIALKDPMLSAAATQLKADVERALVELEKDAASPAGGPLSPQDAPPSPEASGQPAGEAPSALPAETNAPPAAMNPADSAPAAPLAAPGAQADMAQPGQAPAGSASAGQP